MISAKNEIIFWDLAGKYLDKTSDSKNFTDHSEDFKVNKSTNKAFNYFSDSWFNIRDKWVGHLTKKYVHHHYLTTQRAESAHRALKVGMTRRFDLITAFEHINKYRTNLYGKFDLQEQKEHQKVDNLMISDRKLNFIRNKVSRAAHSACLELSSGNLLKEELAFDERNCYCYARVNHQHPCIHTVISFDDKPFSIEDIHKR
ncbi:hypothetical protein G6F56_004985 [Rhizopus delemar]|nr:hypothetical protein G6F56_004985 [Rhizopus delemar]